MLTAAFSKVFDHSAWPAWASVAFFWAVFAAFVFSVAPLSAIFPGAWKGAFLGTIVAGLTLLLGCAVLRQSRRDAADFGLAFRRSSPVRFAFGFAVGLVLIAAHVAVLWAFGGNVMLERVADVGPGAVLAALCSFLPLAVMEELGFRGYTLRRLSGAYGLWIAQGMVALAFALYHVAGGVPLLSALLGTGMGSLLFGMAAIATRGLAVPIGLHAAWNIGAWALGEKQQPGLWEIAVDEASRPAAAMAGSIGYFLVLGIATVGFWRLGGPIVTAIASLPRDRGRTSPPSYE